MVTIGIQEIQYTVKAYEDELRGINIFKNSRLYCTYLLLSDMGSNFEVGRDVFTSSF